jgi:hypothetical protein
MGSGVARYFVSYFFSMRVNKKVRMAKTRTAPCTDGQPDEYATFTTALKKILTVSHKEMQKRLTRASAGRASNVKD